MCKGIDMAVKKNSYMVTLWDMDFCFDQVFEKARYAVFGREICPKTKKSHWQGFVYWHREKSGNATIKFFNKETHLCHAKTTAEAIDYCKKEKDFVESGTPPKQGERTDLPSVRNFIVNGGTISKVIDAGYGYQATRHAEIILKYKEPKRNWKPQVFWYWGATGTGKTKQAYEEAGPNCWESSKTLKWWEGYDGHENIIIDDFREYYCEFAELLRILDRYPYRVEVKGGSRQLLAKKIWITCPHKPESVYSMLSEDVTQLTRRIDLCKRFV